MEAGEVMVTLLILLPLGGSALLLAFGRRLGEPGAGVLDGQAAVFFVMVVAAAEVVVGLAIIVTVFRRRATASVDELSELKG